MPLSKVIFSILKKTGLIVDKYSDKFEKLLKYDKACFEECFIHGSCKMIVPLKTVEEFKTNGFLDMDASSDTLNKTVQKFTTEFSKSQVCKFNLKFLIKKRS